MMKKKSLRRPPANNTGSFPQHSRCLYTYILIFVVLQLWTQARAEIIYTPSTSCVYCKRIVASPSFFYSSLQPQRPHLNYTRRDSPRALRGFCLPVFLQKLSLSALTQGKRGFLPPPPPLFLSLSLLFLLSVCYFSQSCRILLFNDMQLKNKHSQQTLHI